MTPSTLTDEIAKLPQHWHQVGTVGPTALRAITRHAASLGPITRTAETGSGITTLLFSHLSPEHYSFAIDYGASITMVRESPLFNPTSTTYIEGPTQLTLPQFRFPGPLDIALIDGPHGWPFPELEYFYFYPLVKTGGLLIVDDILIPTIRNMFQILSKEPMWELVDIARRNTAFFRRTNAPLLSPHEDGWWAQGYNRAHYEKYYADEGIGPPELRGGEPSRLKTTMQRVAGMVPSGIKSLVPTRIKRALWD